MARKTSQASPAGSEDETSGVKAASPAIQEIDPIDYWRKKGSWPKKYFELDEDTRAYLTKDLDEESSITPSMERTDGPEGKEGVERMIALLARPKPPTLRRNQSSSISLAQVTATPSSQKRETKAAEYKELRYEVELAKKGNSFMKKDEEGPKKESKDMCRKLLEASQDVPESSRFSDSMFESTCERVRNRNEAKVIDKIARLIVPSAEDLADSGLNHLKHVVESMDEGWDNAIPVTKSRPQSDYAVGFASTAFTEEQLKKLQPWVGEVTETSFFMATYYMYFPFFTSEVKCGDAALNIADRQNAHSMTLAVRGVVELFRLAKQAEELNREILGFSVSHDHRSVRIYGHYPVIKGKDTTYYRYPIHDFSITALDGKEKWTAYKFTKNVYDIWMPAHFKRLCSIIDQLPTNLSFGLSEHSGQESGLSQGLQSYNLSQQSNPDSLSFLEGDSQASTSGVQQATPDTSISHNPGPFKKPKKRPAAE